MLAVPVNKRRCHIGLAATCSLARKPMMFDVLTALIFGASFLVVENRRFQGGRDRETMLLYFAQAAEGLRR